MASLLDLLGLGSKDIQPIPATTDASTPSAGLSGVDVVAPKTVVNTPGGASAYNNLPEVAAIQDVASQYPQAKNNHLGLANMITSGGQPGGGITLRNLLGTLGDAFLIQGGAQPLHAQQAQREQIADAAAGFQNNPDIAASRIMATGAPDSFDDAQKLYNSSHVQKLQEAQQAAVNQWRESQQTDKVNQQLQRVTPYIGAITNDPSIKTNDDYAKAYARGLSMAQRIDPNATGADVGMIDPQDWKPGMGTTTGMTQGQNARNQTSNASIDERAGAASQNHQDRVRGQDLNSDRPSTAGYLQGLATRVNNGKVLGPGDQAIWNAQTQRGNKPKLNIPGLTPSGSGRPGAPQVGAVQGGYKFLGGDPSNPHNWTK